MLLNPAIASGTQAKTRGRASIQLKSDLEIHRRRRDVAAAVRGRHDCVAQRRLSPINMS